MNTRIVAFLREEDGITALEYGILAAIVASVLVLTFKTGLTTVFGDIITALEKAVTSAGT
jgi:pilus assembly protein Flp/PilA